jgi:hypothetical protein
LAATTGFDAVCPPSLAQPLQPPLGVLCQSCHTALSGARAKISRRPSVFCATRRLIWKPSPPPPPVPPPAHARSSSSVPLNMSPSTLPMPLTLALSAYCQNFQSLHALGRYGQLGP